MKNLLSKLTLLSLATVLLVGCGGGNNQAPANNEPSENTGNTNQAAAEAPEDLEDRTYIMGLDDTFAPMGFRDESGEIVGFDVDLAQDAAKRMGIDLDLQPIDWAMKEAELDAGNIDFIWNGYSVTPERAEKVDLSEPYLENSQIIIVMADSDVKTKADLAGKTVTLQAESSALDALNADEEFRASLGADPVEYATNVECFKDLEAGRSDAMVADGVLARYYIKQNGEENYRILEEDLGKEEYAVGIKKGNTALLEALNQALADQKADGTYDEIYSKWFSE
ncbi:MAG: amino acid ABC transporter substrate-binding protein [Tissierellia bacterium]|nr:amino acid ABC transporter substrate-binding protein [Tissierellia bacterium]